MKNWEEAYNNFDETRFEELKQKIEDKIITREEMGEYKKLNNIHDNLPKVENLIAYKEKLQVKLQELKELKNKYDYKQKYEKEKSKLEEEMKKYSDRLEEITKRRKEINNKLEDKELSEEDRKKLEEEQGKLNTETVDLRKKVDLNNEYFAQNEKNVEKEHDLNKNTNPEVLDKKIYEVSSKISKCNFVAGKLMEGYDLESEFIREKLTKQWKDRKFKSKEPIPRTKAKEDKEIKVEPVGVKETKEEANEEFEPIWSTSKLKEEAEKGETGLIAKEKTFDEAFPKLSKILPKFIKESRLGKSMLNAKQQKDIDRMPKEEPKVIETPEKVEILKVEEEPEKTDFKETLKVDYDELMEIANKGIGGYEKEKRAKMKEDAVKREEANKGKSQEEKLEQTANEVDMEAYIKRLEDEGR